MKREHGSVQPGIKWGGIYTLRVPFLHTKICWPELIQGIAVAAATAAALVPLLIGYFGLSFEEAIGFTIIFTFVLSLSWMVFGDPYCPGWITPALPFVLVLLGTNLTEAPGDYAANFRAMTALSLNLAFICVFLGVTGFGERLIQIVPRALKGGIVLGAALAAFFEIFDFQSSRNAFVQTPIAACAAFAISMMLAFSEPLKSAAERSKILRQFLSLGLLPGFVLAGIVGYFAGEISFDIEYGILVPPFADIWVKSSPFSIGWPSFELFVKTMPLALITYTILYGDLLTGNALIQDAQTNRPDEKVEINMTRTHVAVGVRNALTSVIAPLFSTQGALWTGVHVVVVNRWRSGRKHMDSIFDGISSYYMMNLPIIFMILPIVSLIKPLLGIALMMTLALTGFACANVAMDQVKNSVERGVMTLTAIALCIFEPWQGLLAGIIATILLIGWRSSSAELSDNS